MISLSINDDVIYETEHHIKKKNCFVETIEVISNTVYSLLKYLIVN